MEKQSGPQRTFRDFIRWATTPPQSYAIYLICLILIWVVSFYAGTMKPKTPTGLGPPIAAPRN